MRYPLITDIYALSVGVTQVDRPAAAPQEGPFNMEVVAVGSPTFIPGFVAAINLFGKFSTFIPDYSSPAWILIPFSSWLRLYPDLHARDRGDEDSQVLHQSPFHISGIPSFLLCLLRAGCLYVSLDNSEFPSE